MRSEIGKLIVKVIVLKKAVGLLDVTQLMRTSRSAFPRLNLEAVDQEVVNGLDDVHQAFIQSVQDMAVPLRHQLELLDDLEVVAKGTDNNSLLHKIVIEMVALNSCYLQGQVHHFDQAIAMAVRKGEIDHRDDMLFSKRGGRKTNIDERSIRRMSFAATNYSDNTEILRTGKLAEMTDLEFLFSLNGYHLPYANSTARRSMYEAFFSVFVEAVTSSANRNSETAKSEQSYLFALLQETIYMLHTVTEYTVSITECIFEMVTWVNTRLKSVPMSINIKLPSYNGAISPLLDHLTGCFNDGNKIFAQFTKRKLITAINELRSEEMKDWKGRLQNYHSSLLDGFELYSDGCERFLNSIESYRQRRQETLQQENGEYSRRQEIDVYITDVQLYIDQTKKFILLLAAEQSVYRHFHQSAIDLLDMLAALQEKYPMRYGGVTPRNPKSPRPVTPRSPKSALSRSQGGSTTSSPRTGSDAESPISTPEPSERPKSAGPGGVFSRLGSLFTSSK